MKTTTKKTLKIVGIVLMIFSALILILNHTSQTFYINNLQNTQSVAATSVAGFVTLMILSMAFIIGLIFFIVAYFASRT